MDLGKKLEEELPLREEAVTSDSIFYPNEGHTWNPLVRLPRNMQCPCFSGKKFKKCCLPVTPKIIAKEVLKNYLEVEALALLGKKAW